jgi:hypothetical protein
VERALVNVDRCVQHRLWGLPSRSKMGRDRNAARGGPSHDIQPVALTLSESHSLYRVTDR